MKHLTEMQRYTIFVMWQNGILRTKIANAIEVHKSTIGRELQRNKDENSDIYDWARAQKKSNERQQNRSRFHKLTEAMRENIVTKLSMDWSPEQIVGYFSSQGMTA